MEKGKILIVDDELDMRIFMATLFETSGYTPVLAKDGREGVEKAETLKPDLIILDVMMPGEGGVQMYRRLRTDKSLRNIPVLMLSAVGAESFQHYLKMLNSRLGGRIPYPDAYLEKPPDPDALLRVAESLLT